MTRRAAGLLTVEGDVRDFPPLDFDRVPGFIASPPCQTFSAAEEGCGPHGARHRLPAREDAGARQAVDYSVFSDERTGLVLEPLRWVLAALEHDRPYEWLAFEQVPTVLPGWEHMAEIFRSEGYHACSRSSSSSSRHRVVAQPARHHLHRPHRPALLPPAADLPDDRPLATRGIGDLHPATIAPCRRSLPRPTVAPSIEPW